MTFSKYFIPLFIFALLGSNSLYCDVCVYDCNCENLNFVTDLLELWMNVVQLLVYSLLLLFNYFMELVTYWLVMHWGGFVLVYTFDPLSVLFSYGYLLSTI